HDPVVKDAGFRAGDDGAAGGIRDAGGALIERGAGEVGVEGGRHPAAAVQQRPAEIAAFIHTERVPDQYGRAVHRRDRGELKGVGVGTVVDVRGGDASTAIGTVASRATDSKGI